MRAATLLERARTGLAAPSYAFSFGAALAGSMLAALWWLRPEIAVGAGLILLIGCGWQIAALCRQVRQLAHRDPLTGAANRTGFADALRQAVRGCRRSGGPVSLAVLDCDDFKQINERFGHAVGDAVLIEVADVLAQIVVRPGTVGRIWGDAFGILLPGLPLEAARTLLGEAERRLQARMAAHHWSVTFSIGVSCLGGPIATAEELLSDADALMFAVKRRGRNGIACRGLHDESSAAIPVPPSDARSATIKLADAVCPPSPEFARQP